MCAPLTCKEEKKRRKLKDSQLNAKCLTSGQSCDNMSNNYVFHSIIQVDYHTPALSNRSIQLLCLIPKESKYICNKVNRNIIVSNRVKPKQKLVSQRHLRSTYGYSVYIVNIGTGVVLLLTTTCLRVAWSSEPRPTCTIWVLVPQVPASGNLIITSFGIVNSAHTKVLLCFRYEYG